MDSHEGYITISRGNSDNSLSHAAPGPFKESAVKRDHRGRFSKLSKTLQKATDKFEGAIDKIYDPAVMTRAEQEQWNKDMARHQQKLDKLDKDLDKLDKDISDYEKETDRYVEKLKNQKII